jgi:ADP-ribose pyrophosphatase
VTDDHLREERIHQEAVFKGRLLDVRRDTVRLPDGQQGVREYVVHPGAVMIIPILAQTPTHWHLVMERQYRYPLGRAMIEFPAGKLDPGEDPFVCAQRELLEETGYRAGQWARAGQLHPTIAYSNEFIDIWFARDLRQGQQALDAGEFLDVFTASSEQVLQWCCNGGITDAKTLSGALWLQNVMQGQWSLQWLDTPSTR